LSGKTARRVIDLRSCINLEIGLEYKNLQYILSIGTFKRTFFFAAASDPLMLQWAYLLEKTKAAQNGGLIVHCALYIYVVWKYSMTTLCIDTTGMKEFYNKANEIVLIFPVNILGKFISLTVYKQYLMC